MVTYFKENVDDLEMRLQRFDAIYKINGLDKKLYAVKVTEFLSGDSLHIVFSMKQERKTKLLENQTSSPFKI